MEVQANTAVIFGLILCILGSPSYAQQNEILTSMLERDTSQACAEGFKYEVGSGCVDIDECHETMPCKLGQLCRNLYGSYMCKCSVGYTFEKSTGNCVDKNECALGYCRNGLRCTNTIGSFICQCATGMTKIGRFCRDINECMHKPCADNQYCINSRGSFTCLCKAGFEDMGGGSCKDTNECLNGVCSAMGEKCRNTVGSYECDCKPGYAKDSMTGRYCKDVDECRYGACPHNSECTNTQGGFSCRCHRGYNYVNNQCVDTTECTNGAGKMCQWQCKEIPGSFQCVCPPGYEQVDFACTDVNECDRGLDTCQGDETCINTNGGFRCVSAITCPVSSTVPNLYREIMKTDEFNYRMIKSKICRRTRCGKYSSGAKECLAAPLSISYHYATLPSNQAAPLKLFKISFPRRRRQQRYQCSIVSGNEDGYFSLKHSSKMRPNAHLIITKSIPGPAVYTLKIDFATYHQSGGMRDSRMVTITVFVSDYEF